MTNIKIAGLWNKVDENGNKFLCGKWGDDLWITVHVNHEKNDTKQPDCLVYLSPVNKQKGKENDQRTTDDNRSSK